MPGHTFVLLLGLLLAGCEAAEPTQARNMRSVVDMTGHSVRIPERVQRIACLEVLCYEKLFLLGASDRIAMMIDTNAPWMLRTNPAAGAIPKIASDVGGEELLRRQVDLAFRTTGYPPPGSVAQLAAQGVPILVSQTFGSDRIDSVEAFVSSRKRMLRLFADVLGPAYRARAEAWCAYHDRMVAMVRQRVATLPAAQRVRLFHVRGPGANHSQGQGSATYWYGVIAGADMVVRQHALVGKGEISMEELIRWNPQVVNIGRHYPASTVLDDPRWATISAVREHRVREMPEGVFYWDGSTEGVLLMLYLAKELYPQRFADLDLRREIHDYYARFYRTELSPHELDLMLAGRGPDGRRENRMRN